MEQVELPSGATAVLIKPNKDSRWLTLEVCREFARNNCPRTGEECKYAHPPAHVEIQNGRVTCCFDSIKGKCQRTTPPCKYLHPPAHLKDQLLETGRQNLILKNLQLQNALASAATGGLQQVLTMPGAAYPVGMRIELRPYLCSRACGWDEAVPDKKPLQERVYNGTKTVLPSSYRAMMIPGQAPSYMTASPYVIPGAGAQQYQIPGGGVVQLVSPSYGGLQQFAIPNGASMPLQMRSLVPTLGDFYNSQMASLATFNQTEIWNGQGGACYQTALASPVETGTDRQILPYIDGYSTTSEVAGKELVPASMSSAVPTSSYPTWSGLYQSASFICQPMTDDKLVNQSSRKRPYDSSQESFPVANASPGLMPSIKRTALVDAKSGLPFYQQIPMGASYQQMALAAMPMQQPQYMPISLNPSVVPRF